MRNKLFFQLVAALLFTTCLSQAQAADIQDARQLYQAGNYREALSLLYRAALSRLIDRYQVAFRSSHTEAECASLVRARGIDSLSHYFAELTGVWQRLAYGHLLPADAVVRGLCERWSEELANDAQ